VEDVLGGEIVESDKVLSGQGSSEGAFKRCLGGLYLGLGLGLHGGHAIKALL
jgi:hypothetical protein